LPISVGGGFDDRDLASLHDEDLADQQRSAFAEFRHRRQVVEHRLARLVQLGIRQARYIGRTKTLFQLCLAAAVAPNLTLIVARSDAAPDDHL
jgi:hypothetical protein